MRTRTMLLAASLATTFVFAPALYANPTNPTVINGSATFGTTGSTLTVTNSPNAIINWQNFSIGSGETTVFQQQSAASAVLNRVTGGNGSQILGALQSNGQVFLINPAGVFFGAGAQINVAGLVASTLNISDQDFLAGKLNFNAGPLAGAVTNQGSISTPLGGSVILVGTSVENSGSISAPNGNVVLAAGRSVLLGDTAAPNVLAQIQATNEQVANLRQIAVGGGQVGIYAGLIRQSGIVRADSATVDAGGTIIFKATGDITLDAGSVTSANGGAGGSATIEATGGTNLVSGNVSATGSQGSGGTVQLLGQNVGVLDGATVDASGTTGGGAILIGGDTHGANASVMNANAVFTGASTTLRADATDNGNGGKVVLWSGQATRAYGAISARGGANGGNGGFVETSSKGYLYVTQTPDLTAPMGLGGTWLLDPSDITVTLAAPGGADNCGPPTFSVACITGASPPATSTVSSSAIVTALNAGTNVTISTSSGATGATGLGTITVNADAPISKTTGALATLTLSADNNIIVNSAISDTSGNGLSLAMNSGQTTATGSTTMYGGMDLGSGSLATNKDLFLYNSVYKLSGAFSVGGNLTLGTNADLTLGYLGYPTNNVAGNIVLDPNAGGSVALRGAGGWLTAGGNIIVSDLDSSGAGIVYFDHLDLQPNVTSGTISLDTHTVTLLNGAYLYTPNLAMSSGLFNGVGTILVTNNFTATGGAINLTMSPSGTSSASYQSWVTLPQQTGTAPSIPIAADSVSLTAPTIDIPTVASKVGANSLSLTQQTGGLTVGVPLTYDSLSLTATSAGSGIALNSTITADSVSLTSDIGATYTASTFVPRSGSRLASFSLSQGTGEIVIPFTLNADSVSLTASNGSILHGPANTTDVTATALDLSAPYGSIGTATSPILTSVNSLSADTSWGALGVGGIYVTNSVASGGLSLTSLTAGLNDIEVVSNSDILIGSNCGDGCSPRVSSAGGNVYIQSTTGNIVNDPTAIYYGTLAPAWISASGTSAGANGNGGTVKLVAAGNIDLPGGTVDANAYTSLDANNNAGNGGAVNISAGGSVNVGTVTASGWGGTFYYYSSLPATTPSLNGGNGGVVSINAGGDVTVGTIDVSGGAAITGYAPYNGSTYPPYYGTLEAGGNGGGLTINSPGNVSFGTYDSVNSIWTGGVLANGGAGGTTATNGGVGGIGGSVTIVGSGATMTLNGPVPVALAGGAGGNAAQDANLNYLGAGGNGGNGGAVDAHTTNGGVLSIVAPAAVIDASGGAGGTSGGSYASGIGGAGGTIDFASLDAAATGSVNIAGLTILAAGGAGSTSGASGLATISSGSGGITQSLALGDQFTMNAPLNISSGGTVHLANAANDLDAVYGTITGDLFLKDVNSIGLGGLTYLDTLSATGNIDVRVPASTTSPTYQLNLAGGVNNVVINQNLQAGGDITLSGDGIVLSAANPTLTSGSANTITFLPLRNITLSDADATVLNQFYTPTIRIGDATTTASIDFGTSTGLNNSIWLYNSNDLSIFTTGNVNQYSGASLVVGDGSGGLQVSAGNVSLSDPGNSFAVLAGRAGTDLTLSAPGAFNVANSGSFAIGTVDGIVGVGALTGAIVNLTATSGALNIQASTPISVNGTWNFAAPGGIVNAGILNLDVGSLTESSAFINAAGAVVNLNGATWTRPAASTFGNAGAVNVNAGTLTLDGGDGGVGGGIYSIASGALLGVTGGSFTMGNIAASSGTLNLSGGTLDITGTAAVGTMNHTGGVLGGGTSGTGILSVANYTLSGSGSFGNAFSTLSLTNPGSLTLANVTASATSALVLNAATQLLIDGSTLSGGTVTLAAPTVALQSSTSAASQVTASGNMIVGAPTRLLLDGTKGAAKLTAVGTMTIGAGAVDVLAGAASASIDPTSLTLVSTGNLTLTGGTTSGAAANISGNVVTVYGANVSLAGGSGANSSATITATTGDLGLSTSGTLTMTAGTGANADAVFTAPLGGIQVAALNCTGCTTLAADPSTNTTSDTGGFALTGVSFVMTGATAPPVSDNSVTQALVVAGSGGSGTSNVSNTPSGDESDSGQSSGEGNGNNGGKKKLSVCR